MQVLKDQKQEKILAAAARMFATRPFHEVLLSDVAAAAGVGKGTIYTYFENKDELYRSVLYSGFSGVLDRLRERLKKKIDKPRQSLRALVQEYVNFAFRNPHVFELMRTASVKASERAKWTQKRQELSDLIESIIRQGIELGQFEDPHPELTALFIPGLVRSALLFGSESINAQMLTAHVLRMVEAALEPNLQDEAHFQS
jgi:AcrR family transcriptional regulator